LSAVPDVLLATDADWIHDDVEAALGGEHTVRRVRRGEDVPGEIARSKPDLVVLDLQIGNMGGMATCMALRLDAGAGRLPPVRILMLLDRADDVFLAKRSEADGWLIKPADAFRLRRAASAILDGGEYKERSPHGSTTEVS
jgi:DNA-binding response OmpR family regulator